MNVDASSGAAPSRQGASSSAPYDPRLPNDYEELFIRKQAALKRQHELDELAAKARAAAAAHQAALQQVAMPSPFQGAAPLSADDLQRRRIAIGSKLGVSGAAELEQEQHDAVAKQRRALGVDSGSKVSRMMALMGHVDGMGAGRTGSEGIATALEARKITTMGAVTHIVAPAERKAVKMPIRGRPSATLLIRNTTAPGSMPDESLHTDMQTECAKFGVVRSLRVFVSPDTDPAAANERVRVIVRFDSVASAFKAAESLNGRLFDGRPIVVSFYVTALFDQDVLGRQPDEVPVSNDVAPTDTTA